MDKFKITIEHTITDASEGYLKLYLGNKTSVTIEEVNIFYAVKRFYEEFPFNFRLITKMTVEKEK